MKVYFRIKHISAYNGKKIDCQAFIQPDYIIKETDKTIVFGYTDSKYTSTIDKKDLLTIEKE